MRSVTEADGERIGDRRPEESIDGRPLEGEGEGEAMMNMMKEAKQ